MEFSPDLNAWWDNRSGWQFAGFGAVNFCCVCGFLIMSTTFQANVLNQQMTFRQHTKGLFCVRFNQSVTTRFTFPVRYFNNCQGILTKSFLFSSTKDFWQKRKKKLKLRITYLLGGLAFETMRECSCVVWFGSSSQDHSPVTLENKCFFTRQ